MPFLSDFRHGLRLLVRSPIFTITSVCSLAIGIAATAAIFSLTDAVLLRPRAGVANADTLVEIGRSTGGSGLDNFGYPLFRALRDRTTTLEGISAMQLAPNVMALGDAASSERVFASLVSGNYFDVVGTRTAAGRFFAPDEDRTAGTHPVVVLAHQIWTRRFSGDPNIVGRTIRLNNLPFTVIGVAEPGFIGTTFIGTDMWIPMAMDAHVRAADTSLLEQNRAVWMTAIGRLKPGVTIQQARAELSAIMKNFMREHNDSRIERWDIAVAPSRRVPAAAATAVLGFIGVLGALTIIVLLIACSNVAAMLLARALERRREVATRLAIGASRSRIVLQLLLEGLTLALLAGAVSVPMTAAVRALLTSFLPNVPVPLGLELRLDPRVIAFAFVLSALTAIAFAILPAIHGTRFALAAALHGQYATGDRRRAWLRQGLVIAQVAMALLLLVAAGLFMRSLQEAANTDLGFTVTNVDTLQIDTRIAGYRTDADGMRAIEALTERFYSVPGVTSVGAGRMVPLFSGRFSLGALRVPGYKSPEGNDRVEADWDTVSTGYFDALQVRITEGRAFDARDREGSPPVAIINETMAAQLWPGESAIGRQIVHRVSDKEERTMQIVGVAYPAKNGQISDTARNFIYVPLAQRFMSEVTFFVRREGVESRIQDLRAAVTAFDPNLPVIYTQTLEQATTMALLPQRLAAWMAGGVGTIGLLLAALGLYGLAAFSVAQRAREIAVRMALGATRESVLTMVLRQSGKLALIGAVVGVLLSIGVAQLLASLLVGVGTVDPLAFGIATLLLAGVLLAATWVPARRAAGMDPMRALRAE